MTTYHYPDHFRTEHRKYGSLYFSLIFLIVVLGTAIADYQGVLENPGWSVLVIFGTFAIVVYDLYQINMYPNLTTSEKELKVEFMGFYLPVDWENVESIHLLQSSQYPEVFSEWFVRTKKLTPLHLLYGKSKYGSFVTGFLMRSEIENVQQVLEEIKRKLPIEDKYRAFYKT